MQLLLPVEAGQGREEWPELALRTRICQAQTCILPSFLPHRQQEDGKAARLPVTARERALRC
jgi:hypothetical protein